MRIAEAVQPAARQQHRSEKEAEFEGKKRHIGSFLEVRHHTTLQTVSQTLPTENNGFASMPERRSVFLQTQCVSFDTTYCVCCDAGADSHQESAL
jgi:hypothetical protein